MTLWWLKSLTFAGQAGRLEVEARVDVAVLSPRLETRGIFVLHSGGRIPFLWGTSVWT